MRYADEYTNLVAIGDGNEGTQNIISQMRTVFTLEDPYQGSTLMQEEAYRFGDYVTAQRAEPVHYDANDNEVMQSDDDVQSIQNESQNRQETLLFFEEQPNVFKETLEQACARYSEYQQRTEGGERSSTSTHTNRGKNPDSPE